METRKAKTTVVGSLLALAGLAVIFLPAYAGSLEPSGPPGPTMKTLDEVEPRIPISQADIPLTINQSGSYYLTEDVNSAGTAITISAGNVTINLMGYSLTGSGGAYSGISINDQNNVEIRNGTIRNFGQHGIKEYNTSGNGKSHRIINIRAINNAQNSSGYRGIYLEGSGHLVKDCTASDNGGRGIYVGTCSTVTGNVAYNNGSYGIYAGYSCTVTGNTASYNQDSGIDVGSGCTVTGNTARSNNQGNTVGYGGIRVYSDCLVKGNTVTGNLQNNIYVTFSDNAIEENLVTDCTAGAGNGIYFNVAGNFYANNRASGNSTNYAGNVPVGAGDGGGNVSF